MPEARAISSAIRFLSVRSSLTFGILLLMGTVVVAHPGKTDRKGGHRCWRGCAAWKISYGEYHLHDRDFRPIRVDGQGNPIPLPPAADTQGTGGVTLQERERAGERQKTGTDLLPADLPPDEKTPSGAGAGRPVTALPDGPIAAVDLSILILLALLLLLLIIALLILQIRRRRDRA